MMKKQLVLALAVFCFTVLVGVAPAHAVYLDSSWYAQLTNVNTPQGTFPGSGTISPHIGIDGFPFTPSGQVTFRVNQSGDAPIGEFARWGNGTVDPNNTVGSISFDFKTYWTQPNLVLELWTSYLMPWQPEPARVWSSSITELRSGHVTINANPNGYEFRLVAVPEPSSFASLGSFWAVVVVAGLRKIARAERKR